MEIKISVVIITFNEDKNIERCILSVKDIADEIIVVDSFSTDKTEEICKKHDVNFVQRKFDGYSNQKNYANSLTTKPYILSLDADEELSNELISSILKVKMNPKFDVFYFKRLSNYCGKWIKYGGWYPDFQYRLFDKTKTKWNDNLVHERIELNNVSIGFLKGDLLHYTVFSVEQHENQLKNFASLQAMQMFKKEKKSNLFQLFFISNFKFLKLFIFKRGFLDGKFGFIIAKNAAKATYLKYKTLQQLYKNK